MDGINPELSNLTCSLTFVNPGDIVFLTSDGVSDNFDPVVGKFCVPAKSDAQSKSTKIQFPNCLQRLSHSTYDQIMRLVRQVMRRVRQGCDRYKYF